MVAAQQLALVIRQRGGTNLIVHTRGIAGSVAGRACEEAVTIMGKFAALRGKGDAVHGDNAPTFGFDRLLVAQGRYTVVYRLVNKVWVMAVAPSSGGNVFVSIRVVESATKGLVTACQTMEISAETISKHYAEAYLMMGAVLGYQGTSFGKAQVEALANFYSLGMDEKALKKLKSTKSAADAAGKDKLISISNIKEKMKFQMPKDLGKNEELPLEPQEFTSPEVQPVPNLFTENTGNTIDDFFGMSSNPTTEKEGEKDPFDLFLGVPGILPQEQNTPPPGFPVGSLPDLIDDHLSGLGVSNHQIVVQRPEPILVRKLPFPLLLQEHWHARFYNGDLLESRVIGEVSSTDTLLAATKFQLKKPAVCSLGLENSLRCSTIPEGVRNGGEKGIFQVEGSFSHPLLRYKLWPGSFVNPLVLRLSSGSEPGTKGRLVVLLEYAANPNFTGTGTGFVDLYVPSRIGAPSSARPKPQWSKVQSILRWPISISGNARGVFRAIFPEGGLDSFALFQAEADIGSPKFRAQVNLIGTSGNSLSKVSLLQQSGAGSSLGSIYGSSSWRATLIAEDG